MDSLMSAVLAQTKLNDTVKKTVEDHPELTELAEAYKTFKELNDSFIQSARDALLTYDMEKDLDD